MAQNLLTRMVGNVRQAAWMAALPVMRTEVGARAVQRARPYLRWLYHSSMRERDYRQEFVGSYDGSLLQIDTSSTLEWWTHMYGGHERGAIELLKLLIQPGNVVFDIGANVGTLSLPMARLVGDHGSIHAFEPHPRMRQRLIENLALNNLRNVTVVGLALGSEVSETILYGSITNNQGLSSLAMISGFAEEPLPCHVDTVDNYVDSAKVTRLDFMKIDTEGADLSVLLGARKTLTSLRPCIYIEVDDQHLAHFDASARKILGYLGSLGYQTWRHVEYRKQVSPRLVAVESNPTTDAPVAVGTEYWLAVHPASVPTIVQKTRESMLSI